jgi:hypothetical protein
MAPHVEILVEEPSVEEALRPLLPHLLGSTTFRLYRHQGKDDLLAKLTDRLRAYASWLPADWRVLVLVDRDDDSCLRLKERLEDAARAARLPTRSNRTRGRYSVINRIAVEELEAWFFGDWYAVRRAFPRVPATTPGKAAYRNPDEIRGGTWEALEREMKRAGYFPAGLPKIEFARAVAPHMDAARNTSGSFGVFRDALLELRS